MLRDGIDWFGTHMTGEPSRSRSAVVRLFVMGSRRWVETSEWPPPAVEEHWYLHGGAKLDRSLPSRSPADRYRFDPEDPTPAHGGASLNSGSTGPKDQRRREARSDVLTYTSDVLEQDVTVIGPLRSDLHVKSNLEHTDFFVRLCDVSPRGRSKNLSDGIVRLRPGEAVRDRRRINCDPRRDVAHREHLQAGTSNPASGLERCTSLVRTKHRDRRAA